MRAADAARETADLADQAASRDDRYLNLSEAARAVAAFAQVLVDARSDGVPIAEATTPQMWDQAKYAADALSAECGLLEP